jgi:hypothetical protein
VKTLDELFDRLGLNTSNGLYITKDFKWKTQIQFPNRIKQLFESKICPDAFFCIDNKPLILFFNSPKDDDLHKRIWNFNESPVRSVIETGEVEIFNGFKYDAELNKLCSIGGVEKLNDFTYFELVTGKAWENHTKELADENRLDHFLLNKLTSVQNKSPLKSEFILQYFTLLNIRRRRRIDEPV